MCTIETHILQLKDGRHLAYQCWGYPKGRPLYFFHGFPGSRFQAALVNKEALAAGVCLVAADRPGFGRSTPAPGRQIIDWPGDVEQLADHLGHTRFGVIGVSCGGPYALACALRLGDRLDYVGLLAGVGPMNVPEIRREQLPILRVMFYLAKLKPWLITPLLLLDWIMFRLNPKRAVLALAGMLSEPDRRVLASVPEMIPALGRSLAEAYHQGITGPMREAHLIGSHHGFDIADIRARVHFYQAGQDRHVPIAMGRYLAERIPHCTFRHYADEGHLSIVKSRFADCLADFLT